MQLRDYQVTISNAAANLLKQYKIAYLSMQVRTGKTITALNTAKLYGAKNVLFVTKLKAIPGIAKDAAYFDFNTYIINFESLHKVTDTFDLVIIDEAHSLGQYPTMSERTKLLSKICQHLPIIYLSGTPSPESYSQLFHQFKVSTFTPFIEKNFYEWAKTYVHVSKKYIYNRAINDYSMADEMAIRDKVQHLFISYTQEEAGFTQLVNEHIHKVRMNDTTYNIIRLLKRDKVVTGKHGHVIEGDTAVKLMNKLHQLYSGTVIYDDSPMDNDGQIFDMSKADYILKTFAGLKIAIFYKFVAEKLLLETAAAMNGLKVTTNPAEFNRTPNDVIFISQFLSGREGINLSAADCLVCYNIDFSAVTYWQVRARLQTKDRTTPADVHWIMADQGIESHIYSQVSDKKNYTLSYFKTNYK